MHRQTHGKWRFLLLTNAARLMPLKLANAIRMNLALLPRANTTICFLSQLKCIAINCLELTFIRHSHRQGIIFRSLIHKVELLYIYILNDLKFLHRHNTLRGTRKIPLRISYLKDFLISVLTINQTYSTYASQYAL